MNATTRFLRRSCPSCGAPPPERLTVRAPAPAERLAFEALRPCWNGFFKARTFFSYARCPKCGLLYAPTFFHEEQLAELYAQMPPNMDGVPATALRRTQRAYFNVLAAHAPATGDYVELGPDVGLFTEHCVADGRFDRHWLFEPNRDVWPTLSAAMDGRRHEIVADLLGFTRVPDGSVGAAVMVHVLDHLIDPVGVLRSLHAKMSGDAVLVLVTHDESSWLRRGLAGRWPAFCLQHPQLFSPKSMVGVLARAGFERVDSRRTVNHFPIQFLIRHLLWAAGIRNAPIPTFSGLCLGLKLGNIITVARPRPPGPGSLQPTVSNYRVPTPTGLGHDRS